MSNIFELENIEQIYNNRKVLDINYLAISKSTITGVIGPNGSGKTTLLKLLAFAIKPSTGTVLFNGKPEVPFSRSVRFGITLLTQDPYLLKRTVYANIAYGLHIRHKHGISGNSDKQIKMKTRIAMSYVGLDFNIFANRKWDELSGGEAQRVAMAARLALKPEVLLLDEPTASVDTASAEKIRNAALKAKDEWGTTIVVASHDRNWLDGVCDNHMHLFEGSIINDKSITGNYEI
jgi:tungstate transport system ATP-binding protein